MKRRTFLCSFGTVLAHQAMEGSIGLSAASRKADYTLRIEPCKIEIMEMIAPGTSLSFRD